MAEDPAGTASPVSLDAAVAGFLTMLRAGKPSAHTVTAYAVDLHLVRVRLDARPDRLVVGDLTAARLRAGFAGYADGHAKSSVRRAWSTWNRLCDHLVVEGLLAGNPMAAVPKPMHGVSRPWEHWRVLSTVDSSPRTILGWLAAYQLRPTLPEGPDEDPPAGVITRTRGEGSPRLARIVDPVTKTRGEGSETRTRGESA